MNRGIGGRRLGWLGAMMAVGAMESLTVIVGEPHGYGSRLRRIKPAHRPPEGPCSFRPTGSKRSRRRRAAKSRAES
jgi:hypothetical protein